MNCKQGIIDEVVAHARREAPGECCGVLIGNATTIVEAIPTRNLSDNQNRFLIDPQGHMAALRRSRALGLEVLGFYHSHPHSAAVPSARDLDEAGYPDLLMMIVSLTIVGLTNVSLTMIASGQSAEADVRLYRTPRMAGDQFEAVELVTNATDRNPESRPAGA
jgi:proteasome lid subunit RPN8/RPN11